MAQLVEALRYKSEGREFDSSLPLVVRRSSCVVSAAEDLNESIAGVVFLFCIREVSSEEHCKEGPQ